MYLKVILGLFIGMAYTFFIVDLGWSQEEAASVQGEMSQVDWFEEIKKGGLTSLALIGVAITGLAFTIERFICVREKAIVPQSLIDEVKPLWREGNFDEVLRICEKDKSLLSRIVIHIAEHIHVPYDILTINASDLGSREIKKHMQKAYPIAIVAMVSPLLGLLGTMIGMIEAFQKVAIMGDSGDPAIFADSIGKALITTAVGLIIAIPSLCSYHYFKHRINLFSNMIEEEVDELFTLWLQPEDDEQEK